MGRFRAFLLPALVVANAIATVALIVAPNAIGLLILGVLVVLTYLDIATRPQKQEKGG